MNLGSSPILAPRSALGPSPTATQLHWIALRVGLAPRDFSSFWIVEVAGGGSTGNHGLRSARQVSCPSFLTSKSPWRGKNLKVPTRTHPGFSPPRKPVLASLQTKSAKVKFQILTATATCNMHTLIASRTPGKNEPDLNATNPCPAKTHHHANRSGRRRLSWKAQNTRLLNWRLRQRFTLVGKRGFACIINDLSFLPARPRLIQTFHYCAVPKVQPTLSNLVFCPPGPTMNNLSSPLTPNTEPWGLRWNSIILHFSKKILITPLARPVKTACGTTPLIRKMFVLQSAC